MRLNLLKNNKIMKNILLTLNGTWLTLLGLAIWFHFGGSWVITLIIVGGVIGTLWLFYYLEEGYNDC